MVIRQLQSIQKQLTATSTTEVFEPLTGWFNTLEAAQLIQLVLILANKSGNFQCRIGIQSATTTTDDANTPVNPSSYSSQIGTAPTRTFMRWDPSGATDRNIDTAAAFRVGVFSSLSSGSVPAYGNVEVRGLSWR